MKAEEPTVVVYEDDFETVLSLLKAGIPVVHKSVLRHKEAQLNRAYWEQENRRRRKLEKIKARARLKLAAKRVYVFASGAYVKIGIANDVEARWRTIRGHNPLLERPLYIGVSLGPKAIEFEREIHRALSAYRRQGTEWFRCGRHFAIETVLHITGEAS